MSYNQLAISYTDVFLRSQALKGNINVKSRKRTKIPNEESVHWFNGCFCLSLAYLGVKCSVHEHLGSGHDKFPCLQWVVKKAVYIFIAEKTIYINVSGRGSITD